jgi:hypothetical protein
MSSRYIGAIICSVFASATDPCQLLCNFDGPTVCTDGSYTKKGNVCDKYLFRGDPKNLDYCYHTKRSRDVCPSNGVPVTADDVDRLISGRRGLTTPNPNDIAALIARVGDLEIASKKKFRGETTTTTHEPCDEFERSLMKNLAELPMYSAYYYGDDLAMEIIVKITDPLGTADVYVSVQIGERYEFMRTVDCIGEKFRIAQDNELVFDGDSRCANSFTKKRDEEGKMLVEEIPLRFKITDEGTQMVLIDMCGQEYVLERTATTPRPKRPASNDVWDILEWDLRYGTDACPILQYEHPLEYVARHSLVVAESAIESWKAMKGPLLLAYANRIVDIDDEDDPSLSFSFEGAVSAALLIAQELIEGDVDRDTFLAESGLAEFCQLHAAKITKELFAKNYGHGISRRIGADSVRRITFLKNIERLCPELRDNLSLKAIAFSHKLLAHHMPIDMEPLFTPETRLFRFDQSLDYLLRASGPQMARGVSTYWYMPERIMKLHVWFDGMTRIFTDPGLGLLDPFLISARRVVDPQFEEIAKAFGKFLALSLIEMVPLDIPFPAWYWKLLAGRPLELSDIREDELPEAFRSLQRIQVAESSKDLFEAIWSLYDDPKVLLTSLPSKAQALRHALDRMFVKRVQTPLFQAVKRGFLEAFPAGILDLFSASDLRDLVSGAPTVDVEALIAHIQITPWHKHFVQIRWFLNTLRSFTQEQLRGFVRAVTGRSQLPFGGFDLLFEEITVTFAATTELVQQVDWLENTIYLEHSESEEQLKASLLTLIQ